MRGQTGRRAGWRAFSKDLQRSCGDGRSAAEERERWAPGGTARHEGEGAGSGGAGVAGFDVTG